MAQLTLLLVYYSTTEPGMELPTVGWALFHQSSQRKCYEDIFKDNLMEATFWFVLGIEKVRSVSRVS